MKPKVRSLPSGKPHLKGTRPLSDASLNLLDGYDVRQDFVVYTVQQSLYFVYTVEPPNKGHFGGNNFVP